MDNFGFDGSNHVVDIIGMTIPEAQQLLAKLNYRIRAVKKDGQSLITTRDFDITRYNVELAHEFIIRVAGRG